MKTLILTTALVLVSIVTVLAQEARPGQPIKGVIVKGGSNPGPKGNYLSGENPLFEQGGHTADNPMAHTAKNTNPYYVGNELAGENSSAFTVDGGPIGGIIVKGALAAAVAGTPIGGIIVKGGSNVAPQAVLTNPLYKGNNATHENALYKAKD